MTVKWGEVVTLTLRWVWVNLTFVCVSGSRPDISLVIDLILGPSKFWILGLVVGLILRRILKV